MKTLRMRTAHENKKIRFPKLVANRTMKNALKSSTLEVELLLARLPKSILLLRILVDRGHL